MPASEGQLKVIAGVVSTHCGKDCLMSLNIYSHFSSVISAVNTLFAWGNPE